MALFVNTSEGPLGINDAGAIMRQPIEDKSRANAETSAGYCNLSAIWKKKTISSEKYMNAVVNNIEESVKKKNWRIPSKGKTPMNSTFIAKMDHLRELNNKEL